MASRTTRIALVAGEASGDLLGAGLIAQLRERFPDAEFVGVGGPQMHAVGFEAWHDCSELAVMGLAEVLRHLPRLLLLRRDLRERLRSVVGVDPVETMTAVAQKNYQRWKAVQEEVFSRLPRPFARDDKE